MCPVVYSEERYDPLRVATLAFLRGDRTRRNAIADKRIKNEEKGETEWKRVTQRQNKEEKVREKRWGKKVVRKKGSGTMSSLFH